MALEVLKHQHGWVAKQAISVEVDQRISITGALAEATKRALDVIDVEDKNASNFLVADTNLSLSSNRRND